MADEEVVVEEEKPEELDLDTSIRNTLRDIQSRNEAAETVTPAETPAEPTEAKVDRARDETGKFTKAPKEQPKAAPAATPSAAPAKAPAQASTPAPAAEEPAAAETPILTTTGQPIDINRAPSSWKPAAKAAWAGLPEPIRAEIHRRESDFLHGGKAQQEDAQFGRTVKQTIEPYRMLIEAEGGTPERAIGDYLRTAAIFRTGSQQQKLQTLFAIDKQFNGGLVQHFQQAVMAEVARQTGQAPQQPQAQQVFQDPRVDQLLSRMQQEEQAKSAREEQLSNSATDKFINAKDDKGQPLYPFVDNVLDDMSTRVAAIRQANPMTPHEEVLKQAYDAAVWANPETRAVLMAQQQAQANQPVETLRKVESARRASAVNVPKRGAIPASVPAGHLRLGTPESDESIRETLRQLTANN